MDIRRLLVRRVGPQVLASVVVVPALVGLLIHLAPRASGVPYYQPPEQTMSTKHSWGRVGCESEWTDENPFMYGPAEPDKPVWPISPPAAFGKPYCLLVGHCGLEWIVDFDGSFWAVSSWETTGPPFAETTGEAPPVLFNGGYGTIRLVALDRASTRTGRSE